MKQDIACIIAEYQAEAESTKSTPYIALTGELRGVIYGYF